MNSRNSAQSGIDYGAASDAYKRNLDYMTTKAGLYGGLAKQGQDAAANQGTIGTESGKQIGQSYGNIGSSLASGVIGSSNAQTTGLTNVVNNLSNLGGKLYEYYNQQNMNNASNPLSQGTSWAGGNGSNGDVG